ncbi:thiosulfohydrolase SoxB [Thioalkalivibrio sp. HK1]|uniref:thiosulfohydrolase SoxB n=1 Tax=Thioalkalivibrio sp. HK1 TaxID=1469245 RepID=UPI000470B10F|nr:thiosulfohydrolase SoxB [Thioalkalivibrio sp. HK1]
MNLHRREFLEILACAAALGMPLTGRARDAQEIYRDKAFGNLRLLHITDCHAQLLPVHFREPHFNIGLGGARGKPPHLVGEALLEYFRIPAGGIEAHAFTHLDFVEAAHRYGKVGGFAHLMTLVSRLRGEVGAHRSLLLDGGDTWQGSGTALWTQGEDMVEAANLLGVDVMTGHWEFTYPEQRVRANLERLQADFIAQNVRVREEALFDGAPAFDEDSGHAFEPYTIKEVGAHRIAIVGQAFPYTPIANPARFIPDWSFGIRNDEMQALVDAIREDEKPDALVLLSHNGMDVDLKMASKVRGIDAILGGHTHDAVPAPVLVENPGGKTLVTNAGSNGKFLAVLDLDIDAKRVRDYRYRLLPVFSDLLDPDPQMNALIERVRAPFVDTLNEALAVADRPLYRRGNFSGTFDQLICDALRAVEDAQIALSPGFRWGTTILPGQTVTMEDVLAQTATTYPETYVREMKGSDLKLILEDVADNLFNPDPYYQQGGDMVRVGGLDYACDPSQSIGRRIFDMALDNGEAIQAEKSYKVAGWATVNPSPGPPIWETVAAYLRDRKSTGIERMNNPKLVNVSGNPGIAEGSDS